MKIYCVLLILFLGIIPKTFQAQEFRYPVPPDSLLNRHDRIVYMLEHFWDEQNIADTMLLKKPKFMLDYLYLLNQTDNEEKNKFITSFAMSISNHNQACMDLFWLLDSILYDSSSSYYNEELYRIFLEAFMDTDIDSSFKSLLEDRLKIVKTNQIGHIANNFLFVDKKGATHRLYEINTPLLLLIFNDPDCPLCRQTEKCINKNKHIQKLMANETLKVLAVTPCSEYYKWLVYSYPKNWIVGFDKDKVIYKSHLYDIQRLPSIYLLDKYKRVLLKEADYKRLYDFLIDFY